MDQQTPFVSAAGPLVLRPPSPTGPNAGSAPHVLVVEDDPETRALITNYLRENDIAVSGAEDSEIACRKLGSEQVDLVVLDRMLPGDDGLSLCRTLHNSGMPVILLTALSQDVERIIGLEAGADDYLGKPFNPRELLARIRAVLRRRTLAGDERGALVEAGYRFAGFSLDVRHRRLTDASGRRVFLTGAEFHLLRAFCECAGQTLSREELHDVLSSTGSTSPGSRSVDVLVGRLRRKLGDDTRDPQLLKTMRKSGYSFTAEVGIE